MISILYGSVGAVGEVLPIRRELKHVQNESICFICNGRRSTPDKKGTETFSSI